MLTLSNHYKNRSYLLVGGTGSLGHTLVEQMIKQGVPQSHITILSRDEQKQHEMRKAYAGCCYVIHDIREFDGLSHLVNQHDVIINAAAMKHIYVCQDNVYEAVRTNVMGQYNILKAVSSCPDRKTFVGISTDKAPAPTTQYGATKMLGEGLVKNFAKDFPNHLFFSCRYGNVALSRGSVVPIFIDRIKKGFPLAVTHPQMTRFLMSLEEAVCLILATLAYSADIPSGATIVPMGLRSCYIIDLAEALKIHYGSNIEIVSTEAGQGEKLAEVLLTEEEACLNNIQEFYVESAGLKLAYVRPKLVRSGATFHYSSDDNSSLLRLDQIVPFLEQKGIEL